MMGSGFKLVHTEHGKMSENINSQEVSKQTTKWRGKNPCLVECFLELCHVEVGKEGFSGSSLKPTSWKNISAGILDAFGINLDQRALKNRFDLEKKKFNLWKEITRGTGNGINNSTGEINWDDNTWAQAIKRNSKAKTFRGHPLKNCELLHKVCQGVTASGGNRYATGQDDLPPQGNGISERVEDVQETPNYTPTVGDSYWDYCDIHGDLPFTQTPPQTQPNQGNTSALPTTSSSGSKKRKKMHDYDADIAKVITLLEGQWEFMKEKEENERANEVARKLEEDSCSVTECNAALTMMSNLKLITEEERCKAMVLLAKLMDFRKTLMELEHIEDKQAFVKGLAM